MVPGVAALGHQAAQEERASHAKRDAACLGLQHQAYHRLDADWVGARVSKVRGVHAMMQLFVQAAAAAAAVAKMPAVPRTDAEPRAVAVRGAYSKAQEVVPSQLVCSRSSAEQGSDLGLGCES